ncbi:MAG: metalloregulator ArsR/SmtB family transcription factor [Coleofasciculaceae cyanobacterium]
MVDTETARYADIFAALGSEPRLEIMRLLFAAYPEGLTVGEIQGQIKIPNSTLSHHLEKLRVEGLVNSQRDKQYLWYSANAGTIEYLLSFLLSNKQTKEPVNNITTQEKPMFERFFASIYEQLTKLVSNGASLPSFLTRFTQKAIISMRIAQNESRRLGHKYVGTEQILLGLVGEGSGIASQFLTATGVNFESTQIEVEKIIGRGTGTPTEIPLTPRAKQVLEYSLEESQQFGHDYIGTEHLLLGIIREPEGLGAKVLQNLGVDLASLEQRLRRALT